MKMIVLAAGEGTRLRPLTADRPKCMVEFRGKPIIDYILDAASLCGVEKTVIVGGYRIDKLKELLADRSVSFHENSRYAQTNMVASLFCAEQEMNDDLIISYADIVYSPNVLQSLIDDPSDFSVIVDRRWRELWEIRMPNPLDDAETMKLDDCGRILEIGKKATDYADVQGQYIGLIKLKKNVLQSVREFYHQLDPSARYDGQDFDNMYMTSFLQLIIDRLMLIDAVFIDGGWLEIDTKEDLEAYTIGNACI